MNRHGRQIRLAEVGAAGQARLSAATIDVATTGLAAEVATRYLAGAGIGGVRVHEAALAAVARSVDAAVRVEVVEKHAFDPLDGQAPSDLRDPSARAVFLGAGEALRGLRAVLTETS